MLTELISRSALLELGASVSEVFGLPLVIVDMQGNSLFSSENPAILAEMQTPEFVQSMISLTWAEETPVVRSVGEQAAAVFTVKYEGSVFGYALVQLGAQTEADRNEMNRLLEALKNALGDLSLYSSWAMNKKFDDAKAGFYRSIRKFRLGHDSLHEILQETLESALKLSLADSIVLALADDMGQNCQKVYVFGDCELLPKPESLKTCSLGRWSIREKKTIFIQNPKFDPRCNNMALGREVKTVGCWPLHVRGTVYGLLFSAGKMDVELEPWRRELIDNLSGTLSFLFDILSKEHEVKRQMRKVNAFREISRVLNSSLDLNTVFDLMMDLAVSLVDAGACCVFLIEESTGAYKLESARGVTPEEADELCRRLNQKTEGEMAEGVTLEFPIFSKEQPIGMVCLGRLLNEGLSQDDRDLIQTLANMAGIAVENSRMLAKTRGTLLETIAVLSLAAEARDKTAFGHSETVRELAVAMAQALGLREQEVTALESASLLHDIGKLGVSESTLNKTGSLSPHEYEEFKKHPVIGSEILSAVTSFDEIRDTVKYHHERFDGGGYPEGLRGEDIPFGARILAIADTFASLVTARSFRSNNDPFEALKIIRGNSGKHFDPGLVEVFENVVRQRYSLKIEATPSAPDFPNLQSTVNAGELGLTEREMEILTCIAGGMNNREIAASLFLSEKTVKTHVTHILKKLNLGDRTKAAVFAIQKGLLKNRSK